MATVQNQLAQKPASVAHCVGPEVWVVFGAELDFDPLNVFGLVFSANRNVAFYSPLICLPLDEFIARPGREGQKVCQTGTRTEHRTEYRSERYRVRVKRRVRTRAGWTTKRVWITRTRRVRVEVPQVVPVLGVCSSYASLVWAVDTLAHESMHVAGINAEDVAECYGMQAIPAAAAGLGASPAFALEMAKDYLPVYEQQRSTNPDYWSPHCYDGGPLDLFPARRGWPYPDGTFAVKARVPARSHWSRYSRTSTALDLATHAAAEISRHYLSSVDR